MEKFSYEDSVKELSEIINKLENGQVTLDESMKLMERGKELLSNCYQSLNEAKGKLTEIKESFGKIEEI